MRLAKAALPVFVAVIASITWQANSRFTAKDADSYSNPSDSRTSSTFEPTCLFLLT